jgi:hypothetical protein
MMALAQRLRVKHSSSKLIDATELARANEHRTDAPAGSTGQAPAVAEAEPEAEAAAAPRPKSDAKHADGKRRQRTGSSDGAPRPADRSASHKPTGTPTKAARTPSVTHQPREQAQAQPQHHYHRQHYTQQQVARPHAKTSAELPPHAASPAPFQRPRQLSAASSSAHSYAGLGLDRSTVASSSSSGSTRSDKPERAVDVLFQGYLALRRGGLLKVAEKRFYFLARRRPELFCCKDETSFQLWLASGHTLDDSDAFGRANGLNPVTVCTVLRADPGDQAAAASGGGHDRTLSIVASSSSKCTTLRFTAESSERAALWVAALREVQVTQSHPREAKLPSASEKKLLLPLQAHEQLRRKSSSSSSDQQQHLQRGAHQTSSSSSGSGVSHDHSSGGHAMKRRTSASSSSSGSSASKTPRVYATGKLQTRTLSSGGHRSEDDDDAAVTVDHVTGRSVSALAGSSPGAVTAKPADDDSRSVASIHNRAHRNDSNASFLSAMSAAQAAQAAGGNVVLFVPAAGSSISVSDSKLARAKQELAALVARGGKRPSRGASSDDSDELDKNVAWRFGPPEYALSDLEYVRGKQREHDATPLESYVEECCQTFLMEATHKEVYTQWRSVCHGAFFLQVNDGARVRGTEIRDTDMFGLLYMTGVDLADLDPTAASSSEDPRAVLTEAFADGFPMEVLEVFTQPPQCYFSWRHWGRFTGKYGGVRGDGALVEVRGFGQMTVDAGAMRDLRLFFKQKELFIKLQAETQRISTARAATAGANGSTDGRAGRSMSVASVGASAGSLPPPPPPPAPPSAASSQSPAPTPSPRTTKTHKTPRAELKTDDIIAGLAGFTLEAKQSRKPQR